MSGRSNPLERVLADFHTNVVRDHAADNTGARDSTAAIQEAQAETPIGGSIFWPSGTYVVDETVFWSLNNQHWVGWGVVIVFAPTDHDTCLHVQAAGGGVLFGGGIHGDFTFYTGEPNFVKVAIDLIDTSGFCLDGVTIGGAIPGAIPNTFYWGDVTRRSIGIRTNGREALTVRKPRIAADHPLIIARNPNSGLTVDSFHFEDVYFTANTRENILINPDCQLVQNLVFDGYNSLVKGSDGIVWHDVTNVGQAESIILKNMKWEQAESLTGHIVDIQHNVRVLGIHMENLRWGNNGVGLNGIRLRKALGVKLDGVTFDDVGVAIDLDSTVGHVDMRLVTITNAASTVSLAGVRGLTGGYYLEGIGRMVSFLPTCPNPAGSIAQLLNPSATLGISQLQGQLITVGANTAVMLASNAMDGILFIGARSSGVKGIFAINGAGNSTGKMSDIYGQFGVAAGASNYNVYFAGGVYTFQNNTALPEDFTMLFTGYGEP